MLNTLLQITVGTKVQMVDSATFAAHASGGTAVATSELDNLPAMDGELLYLRVDETNGEYLEEDVTDESATDINDITILNPDDYYIDGNDGVDFLLVRDGWPNMLSEAQKTGRIGDTLVENVGVVITGSDNALEDIQNVKRYSQCENAIEQFNFYFVANCLAPVHKLQAESRRKNNVFQRNARPLNLLHKKPSCVLHDGFLWQITVQPGLSCFYSPASPLLWPAMFSDLFWKGH